MSSNELAPVAQHLPAAPLTPRGVAPTTVAELKELAGIAINSGLLSRELQGKGAQAAFVIIATGMELGLSPMQALRSIHVVEGKPVLSADLLVALVKRSGACEYFRLVESTPEKATYETLRKGEPKPTPLTWTMEDAKRAGLNNRQNWKAHPAAMLRARCAAALARAVYPDLLLGVYEESEGEEIAEAAKKKEGATRTVEARTEIHVVDDSETFQRSGKQLERAAARALAQEEPPPPPPAEDAEYEEVEEAPQVDIPKLIEKRRQEIAAAPTRLELRNKVGAVIGKDPAAVQEAVRADYEARVKYLTFSDLLVETKLEAKKEGADFTALKERWARIQGTAPEALEKEFMAVVGGGK
jgi:hypothetical protein